MIAKNILLVAFGGMLGSVGRYLCAVIIKHESFPYATLTVNIVGSFLIGCTMALATKHDNWGDWRLFLATGICGGFTTFSSFSWECINMLQHQKYLQAIMYVLVSLLIGFTATIMGYWLLKQS
ncbi:MAG: fluoride efflux transporter CrcB [Bacteroidetes bacterium]|nr:fluoride efflux transporter CrcB [Bacteroidota bacterium]MBS1592251.1 fluoride efflux transporter CrcB [Bacteroidota bacterium]MBS1639290.1 fluoride efflux transporter CrcB [Bacteroidota bacterium]MBS1642970.1 fluoride efflux transporter CrcB [Bacteroidota bacterium]MBS1671097.1 fluoride efflux transporter CrcB [Bacteroidota bacterium]